MSIPKLKQAFSTKYQVSKDGKTIICCITPMNEIPFLNIFFASDVAQKIYIDIGRIKRNQEFKGIAHFKEGDNFDIEIGKKIARKKAIRAYFQYIKGQISPNLKKIQESIAQRITFVSQVNDKIEVLTNEIKELTK